MVALVITLFLAFMGYAEWFEGIGIAIAVFLATFVSTYSEHKNESSFQKLQEEASLVKNNVFRNGEIKSIFVGEIVVGDHILLQAGDKVPVDGKLLEGKIWVTQKSLTGEPDQIKKEAGPKGYNPKEWTFSDRYLAFRESVVDAGEAVLIAETVGSNTRYGSMAEELAEAEDRESPLQTKLGVLADNINTFGYIGAIFIGLSFLFKQFVMDQNYDVNAIIAYVSNWQVALKDGITALILGIIIIVVAVPEGLPMMIAIVLSLNMRKLLKSKVLVRKLLGIETAGSLSILFVDKTGTLTKGHLETSVYVTGNMDRYRTIGEIPSTLRNIVNFTILESTSSHVTASGELVGGNATDRAFLSFVDKERIIPKEKVHRQNEILFSSSLKFSAAEILIDGGSANGVKLAGNTKGDKYHVTIVKGAPELLLGKCTTYYNPDGSLSKIGSLDRLSNVVKELSEQGIRVVALATSTESINPEDATLPNNLSLVGVVGISDEVREESKDAMEMVQQAGIQVVMITGDREETAVSIAQQLNLIGTDNLKKNSVLTSQDLASKSDEELMEIIPDLRVVARAYPTDKSRLIKLAQQKNYVAGMTGDGVNDASALKRADVGFAMGSGTEVAKEASDIVILDDNFLSLAMSILYGRTIFKSIRKFIVFQSTINVASIIIVFLGPFMGFDFPLTLIQLLWVNLVMDTLAALAFGGEPALSRYMKEKPIRRDEAIISPDMWSSIIINGVFASAMSILFLVNDTILSLFVRDGQVSEEAFLTAFFSFFIFITVINALNVRTPKINIFDHISDNTGFLGVLALIFTVQIAFTYIGGRYLRTVPLFPHEWVYIILMSIIIIPFDTIRKFVIAPLLPKHLKDNTEFVENNKED